MSEEIEKARPQYRLQGGPAELPAMSWKEYEDQVDHDHCLLSINGIIPKLLKQFAGKDATNAFLNGRLSVTMRVPTE
ncbi:hypothetical protein PENANT_c014G09554 [Penicillium antarcticum]|uniref:Uncharacterized protein n=1 Tax=Penicillium antarcticum TaxID=416450 RepID=A0A1V6Q4E2_9EURO|nr:hypothetical protein PENANT_c014G09554 [Penicillium antarcticum]